MSDELNNGVGVPDTSASAGTEVVAEQPQVDSISDSDQSVVQADPADIFSFPTIETGEEVPLAESAEDPFSEFKELAQEQQGDSDLVRKLRGIVKTKFEDFQSRYQQPQIDDEAAKAMDLVKDLYGFDTQTGAPTTVNFARKLAQQDLNLAQQTMLDLASVEVPNANVQGYTLAHQFLEQLGLDPFKIEELRQYSRGEINPLDAGVSVEVPSYIPQQYANAYKSMNEVLRTDLDIYMTSDNPDQRSAALQMLQDKSVVMAQEQAYRQQQSQMQQQFAQEVNTTVEQNLDKTYQGLLDGIKKNPAYTGVKLSSNPQIDQTVKDSLIAQINALADPRSILATQAVRSFDALGVKVDINKVEQLLSTIANETEVAVKADKLSKVHNRDYSTHVQQALTRRNSAINQTLSLANKYFSEALSAMTNQSKQVSNGVSMEGGMPNISGMSGFQPDSQEGRKSLSQSELENFALNTARQLQNAAKQ